MMMTLEDARAAIKLRFDPHDTEHHFVVATWGWENDDYFMVPAGDRVSVYGPSNPTESAELYVDDRPQILVHKTSGTVSLVHGTLGALPYPDMVEVGVRP